MQVLYFLCLVLVFNKAEAASILVSTRLTTNCGGCRHPLFFVWFCCFEREIKRVRAQEENLRTSLISTKSHAHTFIYIERYTHKYETNTYTWMHAPTTTITIGTTTTTTHTTLTLLTENSNAVNFATAFFPFFLALLIFCECFRCFCFLFSGARTWD